MVTASATLRRLLLLLLAISTLLGVLTTGALAQDPAGSDGDAEASHIVDILPVQGLIDPPVAGAMIDLIEDANERDAELVVLQIDSEGFVSTDLDELIAAIDASEVPVVVYLGPRGTNSRAGGGAAALLLAAHVVAVADDDATVGPLSPVDLGDGADVERDRGLLARLVGDELAAPSGPAVEVVTGIDEDGFAVTQAASTDALLSQRVLARSLADVGIVDVVAAGLDPLLPELDGQTVTTAAGEVTLRIRNNETGVRFHSLGLWRRIQHAATTPTLIYLLLAIGLAMLLFEAFQPGFGVAGFAGAVMVLLAIVGVMVLPVAWWALALVVLGLVLYAVDTAIAGFGPVTVAATATFAFGSLNLYDSTRLGISGWLVAFTTVLALVFFVVVLTVVLRAQAGPQDVALDDLIGRPGIVRSVLNPEGHVYIDGALWRARWTGEARRARVGTAVRVTAVDGAVVLVEPFDPEAAADAPAHDDEVAAEA